MRTTVSSITKHKTKFCEMCTKFVNYKLTFRTFAWKKERTKTNQLCEIDSNFVKCAETFSQNKVTQNIETETAL